MTRGRFRWTLAVVAVSAFMITLDNTVVSNAMPTITKALHMSNATSEWVATGYILMFSCLMIVGGRLTDVYGARLTFLSGMAVFTGASLAAGISDSATALILSRVVQGGGSALALPATYAIVTVGRSDKQRSIGNIVWIAASSVSLAAGPAVGGFINLHWGWNWIFLLNVLPGIVVMLLAAVVVTGKPDSSDAQLDLPGVLISATTLFALTYAIVTAEGLYEHGRQDPWADPAVISVFALAVIAAGSFMLVERWAPDPMINLQFFRNKTFTGGVVSQMLWGMGFNGVMFHGSILLQKLVGFSAPLAGLVFLPPAVVLFLLTPLAFWLAPRIGARLTVGIGMTMMASGMTLFGTVRPGDGYLDLMPGVLLVGSGSALCMPLGMYVLKTIPDKRVGVASGILNVMRELSGAFGIAVLGILIETTRSSALQAGVAPGEALRQGASAGLFVGAGLVFVGGLVSALTLPRKESEKAKPKPKTAPARRPAEVPVTVPELEPVLVTAGAAARTDAGGTAYGPDYLPGPGREPEHPIEQVPTPRRSRNRARGRWTHRHTGPTVAVAAATATAGGGGRGTDDDAFDADGPWWREDSVPRPVSNPYHSFDWYTPRNSQGQYEAR